MKFFLNAILTMLILLALANLAFLFLAMGSGNNIPQRTTYTILLALVVLGLLIGILIAFRRNHSKRFRK
jgi:hypothetical protein